MTVKRSALKEDLEDEIDLIKLCKILLVGKWIIIGVTFLFAIISVFVALILPNAYRAEALLLPSDNGNSNGGASALMGQFGGLASLSGINLGGSSNNQATKAIAVMRSRAFTKLFFDKYDLLIPFMASKPARFRGEVEIDPSIYDVNTETWVREFSASKGQVPSDWEVYEEFSEIFSVSEDEDTGLITVRLEWYDPVQVKQWLDWWVETINEYMKDQDLREAEKSIVYLQGQLGKTQLIDMQKVFYNLIESQIQIIMLTDVREEYVFEQIDPAVVPEDRSKPNRSLIAMLGTLLGGMLGSLYVLIRHYSKEYKKVNEDY